ncbi:MAG: septum formation initiator family protein [Alphaproteobacteria bacterium]|nr:septum formation initiator family protein [Alphaproteobacteria bacterium]
MGIRRFDVIVTCACAALLGYFAWHAYKGPRGYPYREQQLVIVIDLRKDLDAITLSHDELEYRVSLLRPESIDPDLLDELARSELGLAGPDELIVLQPQANP